MGAGLRDRVPLSARGALPTLAVLAALLLVGCGADEDAARARATERLDRGATVVATDLRDALAACDAALEDLATRAQQVAADVPDPRSRFAALEILRSRHGVSGLVLRAPGTGQTWAGRNVQPRDLPAPPPWERSFRNGRVRYHDAPYLRALIVGPVRVGAGEALATYVLDRADPDAGALRRPFQQRWLDPLELRSVRLVRPDEVPAFDGPPCCRRVVPVQDASGNESLAAILEVNDLEALEERIGAEHATLAGVLWLILIAAGAVLVARVGIARVPAPSARWALTALLVLVVRALLVPLDLPRRFPFLDPSFSPSEFAVLSPLGWLSSPGDFALTALAYLLATLCIASALRTLPLPASRAARTVRIVAALASTALAGGLWLLTIQLAVAGGQTPFFQARTFVPSGPAALMLLGIVAVTATTYLIAHIALRRALLAWSPHRPGLARAVLALAAVVATALVVGPAGREHWIVFLVPILAAAVAGRGAGSLGFGLPGRVLVLSVLATALAYPVLWDCVARRGNEALPAVLDAMLDSEDAALAGVARTLDEANTDAYLRDALRRTRDGERPEGLALHLWLRSSSHWQQRPSVVTVLDHRGLTLESFSLTTLPTHMLPVPKAPTSPQQRTQVFVARGDATHLRCVVGRLRVLDEGDAVLGHVVITVPDEMDLRLKGMSDLAGRRKQLAPVSLATGARLEFAALQAGRVIAASNPTVPRVRGSFGPPAVAALDENGPTLEWTDGGEEGYARYAPVRGAVFAVRQARASLGDALLALSRLIVVGVGLGLAAAFVCMLASLRGLRVRVHHRILVSYFLISVIPLVLLGLASAREVQQRHEARLSDRLATDLARARSELENHGAGVFDSADSAQLEMWAPERRHDVLLYRDGELQAASRMGLVDAELLSDRLPAEAYWATVLEKREIVQRDVVYAGRRVWFGFAPVLDGAGNTRATVGVPLPYEAGSIAQQVTVTGSVLLSAYMLTIVLVLVGGLFAARRLTRPLDLLVRGTARVAAGDLEVELPGEGTDDLGQLVVAFNGMTRGLREATELAARAERESAWRSMASQAAHEIKNPLTPMRLMLQQMQADVQRDPSRADEVIRETAPKVLRQIEGLSRSARNCAQFARLPRRRTTRLDVATLIEEVTALHSGASENGIVVRCEVDDNLPPVYWDEEELRRVLLNLVLNAVESIDGEGEVVLRASAERRGGRAGVAVTIRDTGVGIDPADRDQLFEPQFSTKTRGTGLGLAIVSGILKDMRGEIDLVSEPGAGTSVTVWWPAGDQGA